ncbi:MAG: TetR/AcrR family transcriptional regulator [Provencibacterium sp.]|jgi:AcrR family transcriptional regulator|nr:TetR/AcrR family transcriptional regulator [Provencibacterium sp.]
MRITKKPVERREEIVQAARELFSVNGFVKTTVNDIAQKIGIAKGLFYYYFKNKDEVMTAVIGDYLSHAAQKVRRIVKEESDYLGRLSELVFTIIDLSSDAETVFAELKSADRYMFHQSILEHAYQQLHDSLADMVNQGLEQGLIRCAHPLLTAEILFYGFGMTDFTHMEKEQIIQVVKEALCIPE